MRCSQIPSTSTCKSHLKSSQCMWHELETMATQLGVIAFSHHSPTPWLLTTQCDPPGPRSSTISVRIHQWPSCCHLWSLAIILFCLSLEMPPLTRESIPPCSFPSSTNPLPSPPLPRILVLQVTPSTFFKAVETSPLLTASVATLTWTCPHSEVVARLRQ